MICRFKCLLKRLLTQQVSLLLKISWRKCHIIVLKSSTVTSTLIRGNVSWESYQNNKMISEGSFGNEDRNMMLDITVISLYYNRKWLFKILVIFHKQILYFWPNKHNLLLKTSPNIINIAHKTEIFIILSLLQPHCKKPLVCFT